MVEELTAFDDDESGLRLRRAEAAATGTGGLSGEVLGLLGGGLFQGTLGQTRRRCCRNLLHGIQIDVEAGTLLAESAADNDFSPLLGQGVDLG
jgi:hypothetical protein